MEFVFCSTDLKLMLWQMHQVDKQVMDSFVCSKLMPGDGYKRVDSRKESFSAKWAKQLSVNCQAALKELETGRGPLTHDRKPVTHSRSDLCSFARQNSLKPCPLKKLRHDPIDQQVSLCIGQLEAKGSTWLFADLLLLLLLLPQDDDKCDADGSPTV